MVQDAEANAESDKKTKALIEARNGAEGQMHTIRKDMESKDVPEELKTKLEGAIKELQDVITSDDLDAITEKMTAMLTVAQELNDVKPKATTEDSQDETTVDAEFTEVK
jgi:molecular chaperone DnaK